MRELDSARDRSRKSFQVTKVKSSDVSDWALVDGALQHNSKEFFSVVGVTSRGEGTPDRVMLYQPQGAITGLLYARKDGDTYFLVQARAEPGNVDEVQFGPTVQATPGNYMRRHGGSRSPYADAFILFDPRVRIVLDTTQSDLGERYLMKSKRVIVAEYSGDLTVVPGFVWASASAMRDALKRSTYVNCDLRSLFALTPWVVDAGRETLYPQSVRARKSLERPVRSAVIGSIVAKHAPRIEAPGTVPIDRLENWRIDEWGIHEIEPRHGFSVEFYRFHAELREVPTWSQPLVNSRGRGYCGLACRESEEGLEVQVRVAREFGLALGWGIGPSRSFPPGAVGAPYSNDRPASTLIATIESCEGGRFFRDESVFELFMTDDMRDSSDPDCFWVNLAELKVLLNMSNLCTIELRALASFLLVV
jgi:oxidase EvaA